MDGYFLLRNVEFQSGREGRSYICARTDCATRQSKVATLAVVCGWTRDGAHGRARGLTQQAQKKTGPQQRDVPSLPGRRNRIRFPELGVVMFWIFFRGGDKPMGILDRLTYSVGLGESSLAFLHLSLLPCQRERPGRKVPRSKAELTWSQPRVAVVFPRQE